MVAQLTNPVNLKDMAIDEVVFAHIIGDAHLSGSVGLEGAYFHQMIALFNRFFQDKDALLAEDSFKLQPTFISALDKLADDAKALETLELKYLKDFAYFTADDIQKLASGDYLFFPGGWRQGTGGHAMMYEFRRVGNDIIFTAYNTGSGIEYHAQKSFADKRRYDGRMCYRFPAVVMDKPVFQAVIASLFEPQVKSLEESFPAYLYEVIFAKFYLLGAESVNPLDVNEELRFIAGQLSGTCTQHILHYLLKLHCQNKTQYRRIIQQFKHFAIDAFFQVLQRQQGLAVSQHVWLLKAGIQQNLRRLCRLDALGDYIFSTSEREQQAESLHGYLQAMDKAAHKKIQSLVKKKEGIVSGVVVKRRSYDINEMKGIASNLMKSLYKINVDAFVPALSKLFEMMDSFLISTSFLHPQPIIVIDDLTEFFEDISNALKYALNTRLPQSHNHLQSRLAAQLAIAEADILKYSVFLTPEEDNKPPPVALLSAPGKLNDAIDEKERRCIIKDFSCMADWIDQPMAQQFFSNAEDSLQARYQSVMRFLNEIRPILEIGHFPLNKSIGLMPVLKIEVPPLSVEFRQINISLPNITPQKDMVAALNAIACINFKALSLEQSIRLYEQFFVSLPNPYDNPQFYLVLNDDAKIIDCLSKLDNWYQQYHNCCYQAYGKSYNTSKTSIIETSLAMLTSQLQRRLANGQLIPFAECAQNITTLRLLNNQENPFLATGDVAFDKRLVEMRNVCKRQNISTGRIYDKDVIMIYNNLLSAYPNQKQWLVNKLEDFEPDLDARVKLKDEAVDALYVYLKLGNESDKFTAQEIEDNHLQPLIDLFKQIKQCEALYHSGRSSEIQLYNKNKFEYVMYLHLPFSGDRGEIKLSLIDERFRHLPFSSAQKEMVNSTRVNSDNCYQIESLYRQSENNREPIRKAITFEETLHYREEWYLRRAPLTQLTLTLEYYQQRMSLLKNTLDRHYLYFNLLQPDLLAQKLESNIGELWFEHFNAFIHETKNQLGQDAEVFLYLTHLCFAICRYALQQNKKRYAKQLLNLAEAIDSDLSLLHQADPMRVNLYRYRLVIEESLREQGLDKVWTLRQQRIANFYCQIYPPILTKERPPEQVLDLNILLDTYRRQLALDLSDITEDEIFALLNEIGLTLNTKDYLIQKQSPCISLIHKTNAKDTLVLNLAKGLIYQNGFALCEPPADLKAHFLIAQLALEDTAQWSVSLDETWYQVTKGDMILRFKKINGQVQVYSRWETNEAELNWYRLAPVHWQGNVEVKDWQDNRVSEVTSKSAKIYPALQGFDTLTWANETDFIITGEDNRITHRGKVINDVSELTELSTGGVFCHPNTPMHKRLAAFESAKFVLGYQLDTGNLIATLPRYDLHFVYEPESDRLFFKDKDTPRHVDKDSPLLALGFAGLSLDNQNHCILPIRRFITSGKRHPKAPYYQLTQDLSDDIYQDLNKEKEGVSCYDEGRDDVLIKDIINHTADYYQLRLVNGHPQAINSEQALYLAYLYLGNHDAGLAMYWLDACQTRFGGLKGTFNEITYIEWMMSQLPYVFEHKKVENIALNYPKLTACRVKALALLAARLLQTPEIEPPKNPYPQGTRTAKVFDKESGRISTFIKNGEQCILTTLHTWFNQQRRCPEPFHPNDRTRNCLYECLHQKQFYEHQGPVAVDATKTAITQVLEELSRLKQQVNPSDYEQKRRALLAADKDAMPNIRGHVSRLTTVEFISVPERNKTSTFASTDFFNKVRRQHHELANQDKAFKQLQESMSLVHLDKDSYYPLMAIALNKSNRLRAELKVLVEQIVRANRHAKKYHDISFELWFFSYLYQVIGEDNQQMLDEVSRGNNSYLTEFAQPSITISEYQLIDGGVIATQKEMIDSLTLTPLRIPIHLSSDISKVIRGLSQFPIDTFDLPPDKIMTWSALYATWQTGKKTDEQDDSDAETIGQRRYMALLALKQLAQDLFSSTNTRALLSAQLDTHVGAVKAQQTRSQKAMLDLANQGPDEKEVRVLWQIKRDCEDLLPLSDTECLLLYLADDVNQYCTQTWLSAEKVNMLHGLIGQYLAAGLVLQQLLRAKASLDSIETAKNDREKQREIYHFAKTLLATNYADVIDDPVLTVMQYQQNILLRQAQKEANVRLLSKKEGHYVEVVEQIMMGEGKTSVQSPSLCKAKAKGDNLVILEVPKPLLHTNYINYLDISVSLYQQTPHCFVFTRNSDCSPRALKGIHDQFVQVMLDKDYLITTGDALQSLELKYIELLFSIPQSMGYQDEQSYQSALYYWVEQVTWADKIVEMLRNRADLMIDEVHQGLVIKNKLNYTMGEPGHIDDALISSCLDLYAFFDQVTLKNMPGLGDKSIPLSSLLSRHKPLTNEEQYRAACEQLADALVDIKRYPSSPLNHLLDINLSDETISKQIRDYLTERTEEVPECILGHANQETKQRLALYKEQLTRMLPYTLKRNEGEHYGPSKNKASKPAVRAQSRPYLANDAPNELARHGNDLEAMNNTIQSFTIRGVDILLLELFIQQMITGAKNDMRIEAMSKINKTHAAKLYKNITGEKLSKQKVDDEQWLLAMHKKNKFNQKLSHYLLRYYIIPGIETDNQTLHSDAFNHVDLVRSCQGMSGTVWNHSTFHPRLTFNKGDSDSNTAYIIAALKHKNTKIRTLDYHSAQSFMKRLYEADTAADVNRALVDINANFKGESNLEIATLLAIEIAENPQKFNQPKPVKYVLYFDENNCLSALIVDKTVRTLAPIVINSSERKVIDEILQCSADERATVYDQSHHIGADIAQAQEAKGKVFIDALTFLSSFLQGDIRLRTLIEGDQQIEIIVPSELDGFDLDNLSVHMKNIEAAQLRQDNFEAARLSMTNLIRNEMMQTLLNISGEDAPFEKAALCQQAASFFIEHQGGDFFTQYGFIAKSAATMAVLSVHRDRLMDRWRSCLQNYFGQRIDKKKDDAILSAMNNIMVTACQEGVCEPTQCVLPSALGRQVEVAKEIDKQLEKEIATDKQHQIEKDIAIGDVLVERNPYWYVNWQAGCDLAFKTLSEVCKATQDLQFLDNIQLSVNFYRVVKSANQKPMLSKLTKPVHGLLFEQTKQGLQCIILSPQELAEVSTIILENDKDKRWISTTSHHCLAGNMPKAIRDDEKYSRIIEQVRFFAGELLLLRQGDIPLAWLSDNTQVKLSFFQEHLLSIRDTNIEDFVALSHHFNLDRKAAEKIIHARTPISASDWKILIPDANENDILRYLKMHAWFKEVQKYWYAETIDVKKLPGFSQLSLEAQVVFEPEVSKMRLNQQVKTFKAWVVAALHQLDTSENFSLFSINAEGVKGDNADAFLHSRLGQLLTHCTYPIKMTHEALLPIIYAVKHKLTDEEVKQLCQSYPNRFDLLDVLLTNPDVNLTQELLITTLPLCALQPALRQKLIEHPQFSRQSQENLNGVIDILAENNQPVDELLLHPNMHPKMQLSLLNAPQLFILTTHGLQKLAEQATLSREQAEAIFYHPECSNALKKNLLIHEQLEGKAFKAALNLFDHTALNHYVNKMDAIALERFWKKLNQFDEVNAKTTLAALNNPFFESPWFDEIKTIDDDQVKQWVSFHQHKVEFDKLLMALKKEVAYLTEKSDKGNHRYHDAKEAANKLMDTLAALRTSYFNNQQNRTDTPQAEAFKNGCQDAINIAQETLSKHRGVWYRIPPILRAMLGVVAIITVIPAVGVSYKRGFKKTFFQTPPTHSEEVVKDFSEKKTNIELGRRK